MNTRVDDIDLGSLADRIGFHVRLAQIRIFRNFELRMGELEITPPVFSVLEILDRNPGITQARLAEAIMLDRSSVVPLLDKLEARGLIAREASESDRRVRHLSLTQEGRGILALATRRVDDHEAVIARILGTGERQELIDLLSRIYQQI